MGLRCLASDGWLDGSVEPASVPVLSGGNVDPLLRTKLIAHGLSAAGRYLVLRIVMDDRPGALAALTSALADLRLNVLDVAHHRSGRALHLAEVEVAVPSRPVTPSTTRRSSAPCAPPATGPNGWPDRRARPRVGEQHRRGRDRCGRNHRWPGRVIRSPPTSAGGTCVAGVIVRALTQERPWANARTMTTSPRCRPVGHRPACHPSATARPPPARPPFWWPMVGFGRDHGASDRDAFSRTAILGGRIGARGAVRWQSWTSWRGPTTSAASDRT